MDTVGKPLALVIDDDRAAADALALLMRDWGADVLVAADGEAVMSAGAPRLSAVRWILTDLDLGAGANGIALARELSAHAPQARVLVLTGAPSARAEADAAAAGFDLMTKPAVADRVLAWVERA